MRRGFVRGRRNNVNGPGTSGISDFSVAGATLRMGIADIKLAAAWGDCIALSEIECERPIVHDRAAEICEPGKCGFQPVGVACGRGSEEFIVEIERQHGVVGTIELVDQGGESCNHKYAVAARTR